MKTIEASFEIVTPMFISGADDVADLRPPSIKGALRFWWRALHWGQCLQEAGNKEEALALLHKRLGMNNPQAYPKNFLGTKT